MLAKLEQKPAERLEIYLKLSRLNLKIHLQNFFCVRVHNSLKKRNIASITNNYKNIDRKYYN